MDAPVSLHLRTRRVEWGILCSLRFATTEAKLNRLRIRDALFATDRFQGVTGEIVLDYTANDVGPVWLAQTQNGTFQFSPVEF